eukprot:11190882-Lingulodinium_polyedra.AAC.1
MGERPTREERQHGHETALNNNEQPCNGQLATHNFAQLWQLLSTRWRGDACLTRARAPHH